MPIYPTTPEETISLNEQTLKSRINQLAENCSTFEIDEKFPDIKVIGYYIAETPPTNDKQEEYLSILFQQNTSAPITVVTAIMRRGVYLKISPGIFKEYPIDKGRERVDLSYDEFISKILFQSHHPYLWSDGDIFQKYLELFATGFNTLLHDDVFFSFMASRTEQLKKLLEHVNQCFNLTHENKHSKKY
jgi:hypothetical protein